MTTNETKKKTNKSLAIIIAVISVLIAAAIVVLSAVIPREANVLFYFDEEDNCWYYYNGKESMQITEDNSDFPSMAVTRDGKRLFYRRDGDIYWRETTADSEENKIIEGCLRFFLHESGKKGYAVTYDKEKSYDERVYSLLFWDEKKGTEEIAEGLSLSHRFDYESVSKDFKKFFYTLLNSEENDKICDLYLSKNGKEGELIAEDVRDFAITEDFSVVYYLTEDGELFLKKGNREAVCLNDHALSIIKGYNEGVYYYCGENDDADLAYHNGKKEVIVSEEGSNSWNVMSYADEKPVISFVTGDEWYVAVGEKTEEIDYDGEMQLVRIADNGKKLLYVTADDGENDLYVAKISGGKLREAELYNTDVAMGLRQYPTFTKDGDVYYYKDVEIGGDLYFNKEFVDDEVVTDVTYFIEEKNTLVYCAYNDDGDWVLKTSKNGKRPKTLCENISRYTITPNGDVAFLAYEGDTQKKNLFINKVTDKPIAEEVDNIASLSAWGEYKYRVF